MHHRGDELHLLGHTLGEFLHLLVPPIGNVKADEPFFKLYGGLTGAHAFELRQVHGLVPHLHFAVQAAFFRQVADAGHVRLRDGVPLKEHLPFRGNGDAVDNADKGALPRPVGPQQAKDFALRDFHRHVVQCHFGAEGFAYVLYFYYCH